MIENIKEITEKFDVYFTQKNFQTSAESAIRIRYEIAMPQIDFWINSLGMQLSNDFVKDGQKFKNKLFYHLKKKGWKPTKIKGRWSKTIF
jgi:hypothetical protein